MAKFDFVECAVKAYKYVWQEREQLLKISGIVLFIKVLSFSGIILMGLQDNLLRQGLLLVPSHFVEGIVIAQILVMAIYNKSYMTLSKSQMLSSRPILASAIIYLLLKMMMSFVLGMTFVSPEQIAAAQETPQSGLSSFLIALALFSFLVWSFRLLWIYVPVALGFAVGDYLYKVRAYVSSLYMIGIWLLCFVPMGLILVVLLGAVNIVFPETEGQSNLANDIVGAAVQAAVDYGMVLLSSLGLAFGIHAVMDGAECEMKIYVTDLDGVEHALDAIEGWRVMEIIRDHGLPIKAECGGCCACATCHVYVDEAWLNQLPEMRDDEEDMLDEAFNLEDNSRLSCQIIMNSKLNGLKVKLSSAD